MPMKLLLAVDGSHYTRRMLTYIVSNELLFQARYRYVLFHVQPGPGNRYDVVHDDPVLQEPDQFLHTHGFEPICVARRGDAAAELVAGAKELQCNLLVLGHHGHSKIGEVVMGSVTTEVLNHSHIPVLVVP